MGILLTLFGHLTAIFVYLAILAVDITLFFLLAHFLATKWPRPPLTTFAKIGSPLIEPMIHATQRIGPVSRQAYLWISLALSISRLLLASLAQAMLAAQ